MSRPRRRTRSGATRPQLGVLPSHERLDGDDLVRAQRHLGLVVEHELVAVGGAPQGVLHLGPAQRAGLHLLVEEVDGAPAALLGHLPGGVGLAQELVGAHLAGRRGRHPDRRGEEHLGAASRERRLEGGRAIRAASASASSSPRVASHMNTNSSPPQRDTVSVGPRSASRRSATRRSRWSPTSRPNRSFFSLKRSRLTNSRATGSGVARVRRSDEVEAVEEDRAVGEPGQLVLEDLLVQPLVDGLLGADVAGDPGDPRRARRPWPGGAAAWSGWAPRAASW